MTVALLLLQLLLILALRLILTLLFLRRQSDRPQTSSPCLLLEKRDQVGGSK